VIPWHYGQDGKRDVLRRCTTSLRGYDELIIVGNDGAGICFATNVGFEAATGDFIVLMNDDVILDRGKISDLCYPGVVTHPMFDGVPKQFGSCVCFPRDVWEAVGPYDENYRAGNFEDDDMFRRLAEAELPRGLVQGVNLLHPSPGTTLWKMPDNEEFYAANKAYYESKWGPFQGGYWDQHLPPLLD
jgi:GT2 family glycosyltransferase